MKTGEVSLVTKPAWEVLSSDTLMHISRLVRSRVIDKTQLRTVIECELANSFPRALTIEAISSRFYVSSRTLSRRLRAYSLSYRDILADVRYRKAQGLILQGHLSTAEIARQLGYADGSNFIKAFKNWTGMTPRAFQKQNSISP